MAGNDVLNQNFAEVGQTGLKRFSGFVFEEFLKELHGWRGIQTYKEMGDNDPVIAAFLFAIEHLTRQVKWYAEEGSSDPADVQAADFLESCMDDMSSPWSETIAEIMSFLRYGHSYHEIVYKQRLGESEDPTKNSKHNDGLIGWRKIPIRSQDTLYRWLFDDNGGIQGVVQLSPPRYSHDVIPIEKALLFRTTASKNNPEGKSVLRGAYRPWYFKKHIENIEGIGIERDLAGLPVAQVPPEILNPNADAAKKQQLAYLKELVTNIRRDEQEGIVFPLAYDANGKEMYKLSLLSTGGQRQFDTDKIVQRYDQRIAMVVLADFLLMGHEKVGSKNLVTSRSELFSTALGSFLDQIAEVFNRFAIPRLMKLNPQLGVKKYPKLKHGDIANVDLPELGDYLTKLSGAGFPLFPNEQLEKYLLEVAHLPLPIQNDPNAPVLNVSGQGTQSDKTQVATAPATVEDGLMDAATQQLAEEVGAIPASGNPEGNPAQPAATPAAPEAQAGAVPTPEQATEQLRQEMESQS